MLFMKYISLLIWQRYSLSCGGSFVVFSFARSFFVFSVLALILIYPGVVFASDYDYGCRIRNPHYHPNEKELAEYVSNLEYIFEGEIISRETTVMGFIVTTFKVKNLYRGEMPETGKVSLVHLKDMFLDQKKPYLVRARLGKDNNLYPDPLACPQYYSDEEVVSHIQYFWQRFLLGFFLLLFGVFVAYKYVKHDKRLHNNPYLKWLTK